MDTEEAVTPVNWQPQPTLPGRDYSSREIFELEKEKVFFDYWFCIGRAEEVAEPGSFLVREVADESILVTRTAQGDLRAFYNVCRHRGTRLCDDSGHLKSNVIKCPYHAWTYNLEGRLLGTPNVHEEEGFDKNDYTLWDVNIASWSGYMFVNMATDPKPLLQCLDEDEDEPLQYKRYRADELRIGHSISYEVAANWKIIVENYNECLHCPSVHPELVSIVPLYRKGLVEERPGWFGNSLVEGGTSFTRTGHSKLPQLPGLSEEDVHTYFGVAVFPNLLLNFHSDCVMSYTLYPRGEDSTTVVSEYLFRPETIDSEDFDPSEVVEFWDLVSNQDWVICERAQTGMHSRAYKSGVYPRQDRLLYEFNKKYLAQRGPALQ
ncbi:MAG: aromatic ring-hydroxylating dioxygenase subunit alpha [Actinomycetota bacterium]